MAKPGDYVIFVHDNGRYLRAYDPDWLPTPRPNPITRTGLADFTNDIADALGFEDQIAAYNFWTQRSTVMPTRPDGHPNKPLTAYTIEVRKV